MAGLAALRERLARSPHVWGWIAAAAAVLTHLWTLWLPLAVDDLQLVARCGVWLGIEAPPSGDLAPENFHANATILRDYYRPVLWGLVWLVRAAQPGDVGSLPFHAVWLLLHGLTTWLLYRCLRDAWGARAAGIAALVFGTLPGTSQAVSWIVAGGDMLIVLFTLLGIRALQRRGGAPTWGADLLAGLALLAACFSKESAPVLAPAILVAAAALGGRLPLAWARLAAVLFAAVAISHICRWHYFESASGDFDRFALPPAANVPRAVRDACVGTASSRLSSSPLETPWFVGLLAPVLAESAPQWIRGLPLLAILLVAIVGFATGDGRTRRAMGALALVWLSSLAPAVLVMSKMELIEVAGRFFYAPSAALAAVLGVAAAAPRLRPILGIALLAPHALIQADLWVHTVRGELQRGAAVRSRVESLGAASDAADPNIRFVVIDPKIVDLDRPLLAYDAEFVLLPPFHRPSRIVQWAPSADSVDRLAAFRADRHAIQVFVVHEERYVARGGPIPAPSAAPPALVRDPNDPLLFRFASPVPGRGAAAVRFERIEREAGAAPQCRWLASGGERVTGVGEIAGAPNDSAWLLEPSIVGIRFEKARGVEAPALLSRLPEIDVIEPRDGAEVSPTRASLVVGRVPRAASYRLVVRPFRAADLGDMSAPVELPPGAREGSQQSIPLIALGRFRSDSLRSPIPATDAWIALETIAGRAMRKDQRSAELRFEALAPDGITVEAASAWRSFFIAPPAR